VYAAGESATAFQKFFASFSLLSGSLTGLGLEHSDT
jgi:hypothetical protein